MEPEPELLQLAEELFMSTDSIVLAAVKVGKLAHSGDSTGAQLLKALGAKQSYDQESMQPRVLVFTVKRSMSDRGFKASLHVCKPTQSAVGFQIRKSYSLKYLELVKVAQQKYEHREQRFVEMRIATHHNVSETKVRGGPPGPPLGRPGPRRAPPPRCCRRYIPRRRRRRRLAAAPSPRPGAPCSERLDRARPAARAGRVCAGEQ
jgi:hypothetical protein